MGKAIATPSCDRQPGARNVLHFKTTKKKDRLIMGDNMGCPRKTCPISVHPGENRCVNTEFYRDILSILSQTPFKPPLSISPPLLFSFYFGEGVERSVALSDRDPSRLERFLQEPGLLMFNSVLVTERSTACYASILEPVMEHMSGLRRADGGGETIGEGGEGERVYCSVRLASWSKRWYPRGWSSKEWEWNIWCWEEGKFVANWMEIFGYSACDTLMERITFDRVQSILEAT